MIDQAEIKQIARHLLEIKDVLNEQDLNKPQMEAALEELKKVIKRISEAIIESNDFDLNMYLFKLDTEARECYDCIQLRHDNV